MPLLRVPSEALVGAYLTTFLDCNLAVNNQNFKKMSIFLSSIILLETYPTHISRVQKLTYKMFITLLTVSTNLGNTKFLIGKCNKVLASKSFLKNT